MIVIASSRTVHRATRLVFFMAGATLAAWAPLVPFTKSKLHIDDSSLGLLLLCFGLGAIAMMPLTGVLVGRYGCRRIIEVAALCAFLALLCLGNAPTAPLLALSLAIFGGAVGSLDVGINMQAVLVESASGVSLLSGFHGLFSAGGIGGAAVMSGLLSLGCPGPLAVVFMVLPLIGILLCARPSLLPDGKRGRRAERASGSGFKRRILLLGLLCFILFLAEGSMLDWSALFLIERTDSPARSAGLGYTVFSAAMTIARLGGGRVIQRLGERTVMFLGSLLAASGYFFAILFPVSAIALLAFALIGMGIANIVPMLFTFAAEQGESIGRTISFLTTLGYTGLLAGPALIGFTIDHAGYNAAFAGIAILLLLVSASYRVAPARH
jgi:predicted MFS family arabinose efflux permease